jgi:hypothetical protein
MRKSKATEALRVAQEVAAIRIALKKRGYPIRKRPKQAAWSIYVTQDNVYILTYQPAPISSWVLYPANNATNSQGVCDGLPNEVAAITASRETSDTERHKLENIIQRALIKQSTTLARRVS